MGLYNNVSDSLLSKGLTGSLKGAIGGAIGGVTSQVAGALGGGLMGQVGAKIAGNMLNNAADNLINKHLPPNIRAGIDMGGKIAGSLMKGDILGAGLSALGSGLLDGIFPGQSGLASQTQFLGKPTPLLGGLSLSEAKKIASDSLNTKFARKNLFLIEVSSQLKGSLDVFNLFAVDISYTPFIVAGDKKKIGGSFIDVIHGADPVELSIVTMDDDVGTIKKWFAAHYAATTARDGTVGLPSLYSVKIKIVHSSLKADQGYSDIGLFRVVEMPVELSRREDGVSELSLSFTQIDGFMKP